MTQLFPAALMDQAQTLVAQLRKKGFTITVAESCTGGLLAGLITEIPGSSDVFTHGFVTYGNAAKSQMLGVDAQLISMHGAVSEEVALAMAEGAKQTANATISIAITGIAGPGGATPNKPVGLVHFASARPRAATIHACHVFAGNRTEIRLQAVEMALKLLQQQVQQ